MALVGYNTYKDDKKCNLADGSNDNPNGTTASIAGALSFGKLLPARAATLTVVHRLG